MSQIDFGPSPQSVIVGYLARLDFVRPEFEPFTSLEQDLYAIIDSWAIQDLDTSASAMVAPAAAMGGLSYANHPYQVKLLISLFTFFMIYIDDRSSRCDPAPFATFQQSYVTCQPQLDPVLDHFADCLGEMWTYYDPVTANAIVSSSLEFVSGCVLETLTASMSINPHADRYPYFLRSKTGVAQAYAFMLFPKVYHSSPTEFIQAAPAISYWIDITNDVLSFHKEELAQETANYVHLRAAVVRREPIQVVQDLVEEALDASESVELTLEGAALQAWMTFKEGYLTFHLSQDRYRLSDVYIALDTPASVPQTLPEPKDAEVDHDRAGLPVTGSFLLAFIAIYYGIFGHLLH